MLGHPSIVTKEQTNLMFDQHVAKAGDTMYGILNMGNKKTINITGPTNDADAVNKAYIDTYFLNPSIW